MQLLNSLHTSIFYLVQSVLSHSVVWLLAFLKGWGSWSAALLASGDVS